MRRMFEVENVRCGEWRKLDEENVGRGECFDEENV